MNDVFYDPAAPRRLPTGASRRPIVLDDAFVCFAELGMGTDGIVREVAEPRAPRRVDAAASRP